MARKMAFLSLVFFLISGCKINTSIFGIASDSSNDTGNIQCDSTLIVNASSTEAGSNLEFIVSVANSENLCNISFDWAVTVQDISVNKAQVGWDYVAPITNTSQILAGNRSVSVSIQTLNDNQKLGNKNLHLRLSNIVNAQLEASASTLTVEGTILDKISVCDSSVLTSSNYGGGSGTLNDPYLVCNTSQFNSIGLDSSSWDKFFLQTADIDLSSLSSNNYNMIGNVTTPFSGYWNGGNFKILNLQKESSNNTSSGIFQFVGSAVFSDIQIENIQISSGIAAGILDGDTSASGGLIGEVIAGGIVEVSNISMTNVTVSGVKGVGGLIGRVDGTMVGTNIIGTNISLRSYFGSMTTSGGSGGLIGYCNTCTFSHIEMDVKDHFSVTDSGGYEIGGVVGASNTLNVDNARVTVIFGNVTARAGGIAGTINSGLLNDIKVFGEIVSTEQAGGISGKQTVGGNIILTKSSMEFDLACFTNCGGLFGTIASTVEISESAVDGSGFILNSSNQSGKGGLIGRIESTSSSVTLSDSYSNVIGGTIGWGAGTGSSGGIIGNVTNSTTINLSRIYSSGPINGAASARGCIAGVTTGTWSAQNSFFDSTLCTASARASGNTITGVSPLTSANMKLITTYSTWSTDIWILVNGQYPTLAWLATN